MLRAFIRSKASARAAQPPFPDVFVDQPLVTTGGGGALGDLPAQAPRLSTLSDAKLKTSNFLMELPRFNITRAEIIGGCSTLSGKILPMVRLRGSVAGLSLFGARNRRFLY
jgi:hypothetical protein